MAERRAENDDRRPVASQAGEVLGVGLQFAAAIVLFLFLGGILALIMRFQLALPNARDLYTRRNEGTALWVVPSDAIVASSPEDIGPFFEPANDKIFRHPTFYTIPDGVGHM